MGEAWGPEFESLDSTYSQTLSSRAVFPGLPYQEMGDREASEPTSLAYVVTRARSCFQ